MNTIWFLTGFASGLLIGAGITLFYINRKFTSTFKDFEKEMEFLQNLDQDPEK